MHKDTPPPPRSGTSNPYLAGIFLGLTLLASYVVLGAGLGASGGLARAGAFLEGLFLPDHTRTSTYFGAWGPSPLSYYLVFMLAGTLIGGFLSAVLAGRRKIAVERGRAVTARRRLWLALGGGVIVGFASRLAAGCTSGQALAGGALLLNGSLIFLVTLFVGGYATAWMFRGQWHD